MIWWYLAGLLVWTGVAGFIGLVLGVVFARQELAQSDATIAGLVGELETYRGTHPPAPEGAGVPSPVPSHVEGR